MPQEKTPRNKTDWIKDKDKARDEAIRRAAEHGVHVPPERRKVKLKLIPLQKMKEAAKFNVPDPRKKPKLPKPLRTRAT